jgi:hypothetical protein
MRTPLLGALSLLFLVLPPLARAQVEYLDPSNRLIAPRQLAAFDRILSTTAGQREAVRSLRYAAASEIKSAEDVAVRAFEAHYHQPREKRTAEGLAEVRRTNDEAQHVEERVIRTFWSDLRAILTPEQEALWPKFDRFLRRERTIAPGAGGGVPWAPNLLALLEAVGVQPDDPAVAELTDRYDRELDALLAEFEAAKRESNLAAGAPDAPPGDDRRVTPPTRFWHAIGAVVQFNDQFARRLAGVVPEQKAREFLDLVEKASLPDAYRPWEQDLVNRAALTCDALDAASREAIRPMLDEYTRKFDDLSRRIAEVEREIRITPPDRLKIDRAAWDALRIERTKLAAQIGKKLAETLKPAQMEAIARDGRRAYAAWLEKMSR